MGQTGCQSADCDMCDTTKEERNAAVKVTTDEAIVLEMDYIAIEGKDWCDKCVISFFHITRTILI